MNIPIHLAKVLDNEQEKLKYINPDVEDLQEFLLMVYQYQWNYIIKRKKYHLMIYQRNGERKRKQGTSWKAKLQYAIDNAINRSRDWEEFLKIMESMGYEIKEWKHITFRAKKPTKSY